MTFDMDPNTSWHFDTVSDDLQAYEFDFYTVALHELMHVLGFSETQTAYARYVSGDQFGGPAAVAEYDANGVPLLASGDLSHWAAGTRDDGQPTLMTATIDTGLRKSLTALDRAVLKDIGWELLGDSPTGVVSANHVYVDDGLFTARITVSDGNDRATQIVSIDVQNSPPQVHMSVTNSGSVADPVEIAVRFYDAGQQDHLRATITWGDDTQWQSDLSSTDGILELKHNYDRPGRFTVRSCRLG